MVSRIYTIEENIVLICWKVKCGGSQSWRCGDSSSTRKVQGPLDLSPSGFQTLVCLLQRTENLYLYICKCSICIFVKIINLYLGEGEHLVVSDWPCSGTSGCCSSQSCAVRQSQVSEVVKRSHFDFYQYYHSLAIIMLQ